MGRTDQFRWIIGVGLLVVSVACGWLPQQVLPKNRSQTNVKQVAMQPCVVARCLFCMTTRFVGSLLCFFLVACTPSATEDVARPQDGSASPQHVRPGTPAASASPSLRVEPDPGEIVYYLTHPDPEKVDKHCGAHDRSYVVKHVDVPEGDLGVLRRALKALFGEQWAAAEEVEAVAVDDGRAIVNLRSTNGLDFAGTSCGSVGFQGSVQRTIFQFDSIEEAQIKLEGSCERFGEFMQSGVCTTFTRGESTHKAAV